MLNLIKKDRCIVATFGERLRHLREEKGLKQTELAKLLNLESSSTISQYETTNRIPDAYILQKIAEIFDCSVDFLLGRSNSPSITTEAAHRTDDPMDDLPEEARRSIEEFKEYIYKKYRKKK